MAIHFLKLFPQIHEDALDMTTRKQKVSKKTTTQTDLTG